jgi:hypothetical protein
MTVKIMANTAWNYRVVGRVERAGEHAKQNLQGEIPNRQSDDDDNKGDRPGNANARSARRRTGAEGSQQRFFA